MIVRALTQNANSQEWGYMHDEESRQLIGPWRTEFISGGPALPKTQTVENLSDWTKWTKDADALKSFSGIARYAIDFERPETNTNGWALDLGEVALELLLRDPRRVHRLGDHLADGDLERAGMDLAGA